MAKILLVDDQAAVRRALRINLEDAGHDVAEAGDGEEALRLLEPFRPDIVVTDIFMPGKEGIETIRELRQRDAALPIIAVSGGALSGTVDLLAIAQTMGATRSLAKPFGPEELLKVIAELTAGASSQKRA